METWKMYIELEFPIKDGDITPMFHGDTEVDFAERAVMRVKPALNKLLEESEFVHFHILNPVLIGFRMEDRNIIARR